MNTAFNRVSETQFKALEYLSKNQIRFLAHADFAIDAYDQARLNPKLTLLIDPEWSNIERFKKMETDSLVDFNLGTDQIRFKIGKESQFLKFYGNKVEYPAIRKDDPSQVMTVPHLDIADLYRSTADQTKAASNQYSARIEHELSVLFEASRVFPTKELKLPHPRWLKENNVSIDEAFNRANQGSKHVQFPNRPHMEDPSSSKSVTRDLKELRNALDIEVVLKYYGYVLSSKNKANDTYRIYKPDVPDSSQRIVVMNRSNLSYKGFVDLNNNSFKGDSIEFVKNMEQGDWKRTFETIDKLLGNPDYHNLKRSIAELRPTPAKSYLNDEKIIQSELIKDYKAVFISTDKHIEYLKSRSLDRSTIFSPEFATQIIAVTTINSKNPEQTFENTAFPLTSSSGNMLSMDIRAKGFKAFPEGEKGDALWMSNPKVEIDRNTTFHNSANESIILPKGTQGYMTKVGFVHFDENTSRVQILGHQKDAEFKYIKPTSLIISESPIDALSFHQLSPPDPGENRMYISTAGNPSKVQQGHLSDIISRNPQAQVVLAMDSDTPGLRFSISTMSLDQHSLLKPELSYIQEKDKDGEKAGYNRLTLRFEGTIPSEQLSLKLLATTNEAFSRRVSTLLEHINKKQLNRMEIKVDGATEQSVLVNPQLERESIVSNTFKIKLSNDPKVLATALDSIVALSNELNRNERFVVVLPTFSQKDFNNELKERAGKAFDLTNPLRFTGGPLAQQPDKEEIEQTKRSNKQKLS